MSIPAYCTSCGHELGVGRFCINCGKPVPGRHPEAAPDAGAPAAPVTGPVTAVVPPPVGDLPPAPRYPLFADAPPTVARPVPPGPPPPLLPPAPSRPGNRQGPGWLPWAIALALLAVVAGIGGYLLVGTGGDGKGEDTSAPAATGSPQSPDVPTSPGPPEPEQPDSTGTGAPAASPDPDDVGDLTSGVTAEVPAVAPPSRDRANRPVDYEAPNMWDGTPRTAWRMPGDATGQTLTFDLGRDVVITEVGLVNGYAKRDGGDDWYHANRRILAVQWEFDDGTRITQQLGDDRTLQPAQVGPVATRTVRLHLLEVSPPARGAAGRDFTAISEVRFRGVPA